MKTLDWVCQIEVNYDEKGMWWAMPPEDTSNILKAVDWETGTYAYQWDQRKEGSTWPRGTHWDNGWRTFYNHYVLDFNEMTRTNVDTKMVRTFRIIYTPKVVVLDQKQETPEEPPLKMLKQQIVPDVQEAADQIVKAFQCPLQ